MNISPMQLLRRRLLRGGGWAFGCKILVALTGLISSALLARLLTPQALGTYFLAYSILNVGTSLAALGLTGTVVRLVAQNLGLNLFGRVRRVISVVDRKSTRLNSSHANISYAVFCLK